MKILRIWIIEVLFEKVFDKITSLRAIFSSYYYYSYCLIFHKTIYLAELTFNLVNTKYFDTFYTLILVFLSIIVFYNIRKYQKINKFVRSFDDKMI